MPDFQEVFRMATQKVRPDPGALDRQRRKQRGKLRRERVAGYALAAGLVAVGVVFGISILRSSDEPAVPASQGPEPSVSAEPSPDMQPPFTERFDSPLHGLSIGYPSGWRTRAATEPWGRGELAFGAPGVDVIFHPTLRDDLYFAVVSEPLDGQAGPDWLSQVDQRVERTLMCKHGVGYSGHDGFLDGNYGFSIRCGTPLGKDSFAIVATATRGYIIYLHVGDEVPATYPVPDFEGDAFSGQSDGDGGDAALETVDLRPEDALDALSPSESP